MRPGQAVRTVDLNSAGGSTSYKLLSESGNWRGVRIPQGPEQTNIQVGHVATGFATNMEFAIGLDENVANTEGDVGSIVEDYQFR